MATTTTGTTDSGNVDSGSGTATHRVITTGLASLASLAVAIMAVLRACGVDISPELHEAIIGLIGAFVSAILGMIANDQRVAAKAARRDE